MPTRVCLYALFFIFLTVREIFERVFSVKNDVVELSLVPFVSSTDTIAIWSTEKCLKNALTDDPDLRYNAFRFRLERDVQAGVFDGSPVVDLKSELFFRFILRTAFRGTHSKQTTGPEREDGESDNNDDGDRKNDRCVWRSRSFLCCVFFALPPPRGVRRPENVFGSYATPSRRAVRCKTPCSARRASPHSVRFTFAAVA